MEDQAHFRTIRLDAPTAGHIHSWVPCVMQGGSADQVAERHQEDAEERPQDLAIAPLRAKPAIPMRRHVLLGSDDEDKQGQGDLDLACQSDMQRGGPDQGPKPSKTAKPKVWPLSVHVHDLLTLAIFVRSKNVNHLAPDGQLKAAVSCDKGQAVSFWACRGM